jgi:hypothetical protein
VTVLARLPPHQTARIRASRRHYIMRCSIERVSNINDLDSGAPLRPDFKALMGTAGTPRTIYETRSNNHFKCCFARSARSEDRG